MEPKYLPHEIPENIPVGAGDGMGTSIADVGSLRRKLSDCQRQLAEQTRLVAEYKRLFEEAQKQEPVAYGLFWKGDDWVQLEFASPNFDESACLSALEKYTPEVKKMMVVLPLYRAPIPAQPAPRLSGE